MVVDQDFLRRGKRFLDSVQLLRDIETRPLRFEHADDCAQVPLGTPEALDDFRMGLMKRTI